MKYITQTFTGIYRLWYFWVYLAGLACVTHNHMIIGFTIWGGLALVWAYHMGDL